MFWKKGKTKMQTDLDALIGKSAAYIQISAFLLKTINRLPEGSAKRDACNSVLAVISAKMTVDQILAEVREVASQRRRPDRVGIESLLFWKNGCTQMENDLTALIASSPQLQGA
ncbi:MAG: hypothetical protein NTV32_00190 [Gammaproteobacteria bacterium]|nr:hypothetical protein [Gammaproteobacteria bacterium]